MLIGAHVALRPETVDDAQMLADWISDPAFLGEYFNIWPVTRQEIERRRADPRDPEIAPYLIVRCEDNQPLGRVGSFNPFAAEMRDMFRGKEIYWAVHPEFRRQGIATQAARLLVNHLFDATPVERIEATVVTGNDGSSRVAEAAGMRCDGLYRRVMFLHGRYVDMHLYAIVREDWGDEKTFRERFGNF